MRKSNAALIATVVTAVMATGLVGTTPEPSAGAGGTFGSMQVVCRPSHTSMDNLIVYPGQPGAAHQHEFFANVSTDADSTLRSLRGKRTTCSRRGDTAAYWTPTVTNNGVRVVPDRFIAYYRTTKIRDIDSNRPVPARPEDDRRVLVGHGGEPAAHQDRQLALRRRRHRNGDAASVLPQYHDRDLDAAYRVPELLERAHPRDSADHQSHMAYAGVGGVRGCPSSHPVPVPELSLNFRYKISGSLSGVELASGGVHSAHADFFNSWKQRVLARLVKKCLNAGRVCNSSISDAPDPEAGVVR